MDTEITSIPEQNVPEPVPPAPDPFYQTNPRPARFRLGGIFLILGLAAAFVIGGLASYFIFAFPLRGELANAREEIAALTQNGAVQVEAQDVSPDDVIRYDIPVDDDPGYGPVDAPIVIVEFSDYECPFCKKWYDETWPQIQSKYGDQVRLVYRDFPLFTIHPNASSAALAANCANDQDKYWDFHNMLFSSPDPYSTETYTAIATQLKLDLSAFNQCFESQKYKAEVDADYQFAADLGVSSTPTFFINGLALVGAQPFSVFDQVITMELNGEIPQK